MAGTFQDFLDQYKTTVTAANKAKIAAAQKAATAAAKLVKFNSSDPVKKEQEQAAFLAAAEAASNLLGTSKRWSTGAASNAEVKKAFDVYTKAVAALKKLNPTRATAVEKSILYTTPETSATLGSSYYTGKGTKANPFLQSGKPFTGTYNNRKYKNGIEVTAAAPTGITPTPSATTTPAPTPNKPTGSTTATGTGTGTGATATGTGTGATGTGTGAGAGATGSTETPPTAAKLTIQEIIDKVAKNYGAIDAIFKTDTELQALLQKAIGADGIPGTTDDLTVDQFTNELQNTNWFKKSAGELQRRGFYKRQYDELRKTLSAEDLKNLDNTSEYGRGLKNTRQIITDEAKRQGITLDEADLDLMARDLYDFANEDKPALIKAALRAKIAYKPGQVLGGVSGQNLAELRATAAANGLDFDKSFGSNTQTWLQNIAQGESIETYKQRIRDSAKLGVPNTIKDLIGQGIDLATIYTPYKNVMANVLQINPESITLFDPVLRSAITDKGEMSLFDFQRALRKDSRWQYTSDAKDEVSKAVLSVAKDFGFMG